MQAKLSQNSKKNAAAIVAVSLVLGIMIGLGFQTTEAQLTDPRLGAKTPKQYGAATAAMICGDRLCDEPQQGWDIEETDKIGNIDRNDPDAPEVKLLGVDKYRPSTNKQDAITYKITYRVFAGEHDLKDIEVRVKTDMGVWDFGISSLNKLSSSVNVARVKVLDPDSITGEIIGYSITGPTDRTAKYLR